MKAQPRKRKVKKTTGYHHGDLREAILESAKKMLQRDGWSAVSLRACAKEIGVSHAAPAHHFPTRVSLLTALASTGFDKLADALDSAAVRQKLTPNAFIRIYFRFYQENKEMSLLLNQLRYLDPHDEALRAARRRTQVWLARVISASLDRLTLDQAGMMIAIWSVSYGLATLRMSGRLEGLRQLAPAGTTEMDLVEAALSMVNFD